MQFSDSEVATRADLSELIRSIEAAIVAGTLRPARRRQSIEPRSGLAVLRWRRCSSRLWESRFPRGLLEQHWQLSPGSGRQNLWTLRPQAATRRQSATSGVLRNLVNRGLPIGDAVADGAGNPGIPA